MRVLPRAGAFDVSATRSRPHYRRKAWWGGQFGEPRIVRTLCNRHKGTDLASVDPETGEMWRLFHPRRDRWREHFQSRDGVIVPLTAIGRVTVRLLQLNRVERVKERKLMIEAGLLRD